MTKPPTPSLTIVTLHIPNSAQANESTRLLPTNAARSNSSRQASAKKFRPLESSRHLVLGSWINVLLVAVPLSFAGQFFVLYPSVKSHARCQPNSQDGAPRQGSRRRSSPSSRLQRYAARRRRDAINLAAPRLVETGTGGYQIS